jgi:prepilin-type N-terminal cleavage/methylation domain-containing protein
MDWRLLKIPMRIDFLKKQEGQSLLELVVAMAVFAVLAAALSTALLSGLDTREKSVRILSARVLADEAAEALRDIAANEWNAMRYEQSAIIASDKWELAGEGTSGQIGAFARTVIFSPAYRDKSSHEPSVSGEGAYNDVMSKWAEAVVSWTREAGRQAFVSDKFLLSAYSAKTWMQNNWSGWGGQEIWILGNSYDGDDGNIDTSAAGGLKLAMSSTTAFAAAGVLYSSAFNCGQPSSFVAISWDENLPCGGCLVKAQIKTAPDNGGSPGAWSSFWQGPAGENGNEDDFFTVSTGEIISTDHNLDQWIKYRILLYGNGEETPVVSGVRVYYQ